MSASSRKIVAIFILFAIMLGWIVSAATIGSQITEAPGWLQLLFYVLAGVLWVLPMRYVFRWMNSAPDSER